MLGHGERDPMAGRLGEFTLLEFGPHTGIGTQHRGRTGQHTDQFVDLAATHLDALEDWRALFGSGQFVVDMESADFCLYGHDVTLPSVSRSDGSRPGLVAV